MVFGDFSNHYVVHAGRQDSADCKPSLHVAMPVRLLAEVDEDTPLDATSCYRTIGFIRALLGTPRSVSMLSSSGEVVV